jgi:transcriptional regulator with XRE-family HTH domain
MDRKEMLAKRLRDLRTAAKLTQEQVADLFRPKVSRAAVAQWESVDSPTVPDLFRLGILARAYGTTIDYIVTGAEPQLENQLPSELRTITEALSTLPPDQVRYHRDAILRDASVAQALPTLKGSSKNSADYKAAVQTLDRNFGASKRGRH